MTTNSMDLTIHKTLHVAVPPERAFAVFTEDMLEWWPVASHSIGAGEVSVDWRVGGLCVELIDGVPHEWFEIYEFEPPRALAAHWRVNPERPATRLRVTFEAEGDGTRVEMTHGGWEAYGEAGTTSSGAYNDGWAVVLGEFTRATHR